ncbi:hypothetical protein B0H13DRAFT_2025549 [Mycena leptocephala]|nr:hypothetical protein B0H13DRAFT_2025549 [Mycena leptocephala]
MHSRLVAALVLIGFANTALANNRFYSYYVGIGDPDKAVDAWFKSEPFEWFSTTLGPINDNKAVWRCKNDDDDTRLASNTTSASDDATNYNPAPWNRRTISGSTTPAHDAVFPLQVTMTTPNHGNGTAVLSDVLGISYAVGPYGPSLWATSNFRMVFCVNEDD